MAAYPPQTRRGLIAVRTVTAVMAVSKADPASNPFAEAAYALSDERVAHIVADAVPHVQEDRP